MTAFKDDLFVGKTVFVAGGTSGINLGIARRLGELGAKVAVAGRNPDKATHAAAEGGARCTRTPAVGRLSATRHHEGVAHAGNPAPDALQYDG